MGVIFKVFSTAFLKKSIVINSTNFTTINVCNVQWYVINIFDHIGKNQAVRLFVDVSFFTEINVLKCKIFNYFQ